MKKYKYKVIILDINKDNLHEELNKYGEGGYKIIDIRDLPESIKNRGLKREYTLISEFEKPIKTTIAQKQK